MEQVTKAILAAAQFNNQLTGEPVSEKFTKQIRRLGAGIFQLVVMGEIKKGKSSFINAFLGMRDLVPVASDVATSTVFKIHYGREIVYRVFFEKSTGKEPISITPGELAEYGTENGNPGNVKQVDFIEVAAPSPLLKSGLLIIDTPGLGGLFKEHKKITWNYIPKADAVFFVTDSIESPIGQEELEHLETVRKITPHVYFVQTKASGVDTEACEARRRNNLSILSRAFNMPAEKIPYFVVDSLRKFSADEDENLKRLERSGYPELMNFVNSTLLSQQKRILVSKAVGLATPILTSLKNNLSGRKETISVDSAEKQQQMNAAIAQAESELTNWQAKEQPELTKTIHREFSALMDECERDCSKLRPNGEIHSRLEAAINDCNTKKELAAFIETLSERLPETASACVTEIRAKIENGICEILKKICIQSKVTDTTMRFTPSANDTNNMLLLAENNNFAQVMKTLTEEKRFFDTLRSHSMGGSVGATVGNIVGGALGAFIPGVGPVVGANIGGILGALWGGYEAGKTQNIQDLKQAKFQATNALNKNVASIYSEVIGVIRSIFKQFNENLEDAMKSALTQRTGELRKIKEGMLERARMNTTELTAAKNALTKDEATLRAIIKALEPWMPKTEQA